MGTHRILLACSALALLMNACGDEKSDSASASASESASASATEGTASDSASASASDSASGASASASASETASASDTTDPSTTTTTTTTTGDPTTGDATSDGTGGAVDACAPEANDDECSMCLKTATADGGCCDQLTTCRANADCNCVIDCLEVMDMGVSALAACQEQCNTGPTLPPGGVDLSACQAVNCPACAT